VHKECFEVRKQKKSQKKHVIVFKGLSLQYIFLFKYQLIQFILAVKQFTKKKSKTGLKCQQWSAILAGKHVWGVVCHKIRVRGVFIKIKSLGECCHRVKIRGKGVQRHYIC
jgi:hypothetical protein